MIPLVPRVGVVRLEKKRAVRQHYAQAVFISGIPSSDSISAYIRHVAVRYRMLKKSRGLEANIDPHWVRKAKGNCCPRVNQRKREMHIAVHVALLMEQTEFPSELCARVFPCLTRVSTSTLFSMIYFNSSFFNDKHLKVLITLAWRRFDSDEHNTEYINVEITIEQSDRIINEIRKKMRRLAKDNCEYEW